MKNLTFWQCYEESPYLAYLFDDVHLPECEERQLQQSVFDDYFVTFQCLPMVDYLHYADLAEEVYGPGVDLDESLQPKRTLFDYVMVS
ncbi:hypothetical protein AAVH_24686 [Aphelenchoides avenae]|nr:hypothetical protein AAVH_24686 [Aphelenchus avenae]